MSRQQQDQQQQSQASPAQQFDQPMTLLSDQETIRVVAMAKEVEIKVQQAKDDMMAKSLALNDQHTQCIKGAFS